MANEEHLRIITEGAEAWNKWRKMHPKIEPNLIGADLVGLTLSHCDLSGTNLSQADLSKINLLKVDFSYSDLTRANFIEAKFKDVNFTRADFSSSNLSFADLSGAKIPGANFLFADLSYANLSDAMISNVILESADLSHATLFNANLSNCSLRDSNLTYVDFRQTKLEKIKLTGARIYNSARPGWNIEDIDCEYIYLDEEGEEKYPRDRFFEPKEFERLFRTNISTIEFVFENGMSPYDPLLMDWIAAKIQNDLPHLNVSLISIDRIGIKPRAIFEVASPDVKGQAYNEIIRHYQEIIRILSLRNEQSEKLIQQLMDFTRFLLQQQNLQSKQITNITIEENIMGDKYIVGQAGAVGPQSHAQGITFNQNFNQSGSSIDLARLADELSVLHQAMRQQALAEPEHDLAISDIGKAEQAAKTGDAAKTVQYLKSAGKWALDFASKIGASLVAEIIKSDMDIK